MAGAVRTSTTELGDSRVRVEVEVEPQAVERELRAAARNLARDMKLPGFRAGKVPPEVVLQRIGREAVLDEAVRSALPGWYEAAVADARVVTVGDPKLDLADLPQKGAPLSFTIEVGVRPKATLGEYKGLEVGRDEPVADAERIDAQLERMRDQLASLETVEREAATGDFLVLDFVGRVAEPGAEGPGEPFEGGEARGHLLELGSGRLIPGFEDQLEGARAGEERQVRVRFPDDYHAEHLAGRDATFDVTVREVKEKRVPELDDDFAADAGGFDSLEELRADVERRLREVDEQRVDAEFREAAVDAAVAQAQVDVPDELVTAKAREMWERTAHRMAHQGIDARRYLELTGKTEDELIEESKPDAESALKRESVLAAIVEAESIEVGDDELLESLSAAAGPEGGRPSDERKLRKALERLKSQGRDDLLREDVAMRKAVDLLVEHAKPIPRDQAEAREKIWTPEKERKEQGAIWTPGSS